MVVSGIEIISLVATVISGFHSAQQIIKEQKAKLREKKLQKTKLKQLDELDESLSEGITSVQTEYARHHRVLGQRYQFGDDDARNNLNVVLGLQHAFLIAMRQHFSKQANGNGDFYLKSNNERIRSDTLNALRQLSQRQKAQEPRINESQKQPPPALASIDLCPLAISYRDNQGEFDALSHRIGSACEFKWCCNWCGRKVARTSLPVRTDVKVWIGPSGLFKAHCGTGRGWKCIWESFGEECEQQFGTRKDLMMHMIEFHVREVGDSAEKIVSLPAGLRRKGIQYCGYGVRIGKREMIETGGRFIVPAL